MKNFRNFKVGDKIRIVSMNNPGSSIDDSRYNGKTGEITDIDDEGLLHGTWGGLAVIPEVDEIEVINESYARHINEYNSEDALNDFEIWLGDLTDDEFLNVMEDYYMEANDDLDGFDEWIDLYTTSNGTPDKEAAFEILNDYFNEVGYQEFINESCDKDDELHNVISQDKKTGKWRIRGHKGFWPQRYSSRKKAENALKAFHANEELDESVNTKRPSNKKITYLS